MKSGAATASSTRCRILVRLGGRVVGHPDAKGRLVTGDVAALVPTTVRIDDKAMLLGPQEDETEKTAMPVRLGRHARGVSGAH